jgi:hypothetical protein
MRTTIELPDDLLKQAKSSAALAGVSLRQFFIEAVEQKLEPQKTKVRRDPPSIGPARGLRLPTVTRRMIDEALFS